MEGEAVKRCTLCEKDIEQSKYRLHEAACARNNYKCQKCGEAVLKAERDTHE